VANLSIGTTIHNLHQSKELMRVNDASNPDPLTKILPPETPGLQL